MVVRAHCVTVDKEAHDARAVPHHNRRAGAQVPAVDTHARGARVVPRHNR